LALLGQGRLKLIVRWRNRNGVLALRPVAQLAEAFRHIPDAVTPVARVDTGRVRSVLAEAWLAYCLEFVGGLTPAMVQRCVICRVRRSRRAEACTEHEGSGQHFDAVVHLASPCQI
jgi:hypothetical protein